MDALENNLKDVLVHVPLIKKMPMLIQDRPTGDGGTRSKDVFHCVSPKLTCSFLLRFALTGRETLAHTFLNVHTFVCIEFSKKKNDPIYTF